MASVLYPPGPPQIFPGEHLISFRRDPTGFLTDLAREYGDMALFRFGSQRVFFLNHPDYIRDVLVTHNKNFIKTRRTQRLKLLMGEGLLTSEGDFHLRQRRLAQPAFHRQRIDAYATVMVRYGARMRERWQDGETLDIHHEMMRLTLSVVSKTLFGTDVESEADEIGAALTSLLELFNRMTLPFAEFVDGLPLPANRRFARLRARLDETIYRIIEERRASGEDRGDLLSMLLAAQDDAGVGGRMTAEQVRDEVMTLFLAGHETTANALTWSWYLLSQNPEAETRFHAEIDAALAGRLPTTAELPQLPYARMVLSEAMRLYPPAWILTRQALADHEVGGYVLPAGSIVMMSQYVAHRDPRYYPDPLSFDPERWTPEAQNSRPRFSYFPFGAGSRKCIGESFAWTEGVLLLATLGQWWRMRLVPGHPVGIRPVVTLRPRRGIKMTLERRRAGGS